MASLQVREVPDQIFEKLKQEAARKQVNPLEVYLKEADWVILSQGGIPFRDRNLHSC